MSLWSKHSILIINSNSKTQCSASDKMCYEKLNYRACTKQTRTYFPWQTFIPTGMWNESMTYSEVVNIH
jgi:hypothetical protein